MSTLDSTANAGAAELASPRASARRVRTFTADISAVGEPALWAFGGALCLGLLLVVGFLFMIFWNGVTTFWPKPIVLVELRDGTVVAGEPRRDESYRPGPQVLESLSEADRESIVAADGFAHRVLYRVGNYDLTGEDFRWVSDFEVGSTATPGGMYLFERQEWGTFVGRIAGLVLDEREVDPTALGFEQIRAEQRAARDRWDAIRSIERDDIGVVNHAMEGIRLDLRGIALREGEDSQAWRDAAARTRERVASLQAQYEQLVAAASAIKARDARYRIVLEAADGRQKETQLSQIVRFYPANQLSGIDKVAIYLSRWWEFVSSEPREANTEGGILPAIFGTVAMTLLLVVFVAPFGVVTALYLREYAKQGRLVAAVRICVNNLAGVPSIVYGVFGLGFFAYTMGYTIDQLFYPERLPSPTFGTGGILWASLTLALLTVPVVIVAAEEALSAVPRSMREGSLACGASKWQTIKYVVLPRAMPGVMTGLILAMARGAGEVAPLMLIGVVKLAPELPVDGFFPFVHLERSFMHLGFHIFDVGFQSRNSEAGKPMVFVTTLLLLALIVIMNSTAIYIRNRLKRRYSTGQF